VPPTISAVVGVLGICRLQRVMVGGRKDRGALIAEEIYESVAFRESGDMSKRSYVSRVEIKMRVW